MGQAWRAGARGAWRGALDLELEDARAVRDVELALDEAEDADLHAERVAEPLAYDLLVLALVLARVVGLAHLALGERVCLESQRSYGVQIVASGFTHFAVTRATSNRNIVFIFIF